MKHRLQPIHYHIKDKAEIDDILNSKFESESFDYILDRGCFHVLSIDDRETYLNQIKRILKKNGKLIIFEPNCSILLQIIILITRHEEIDFTKNVWNLKNPKLMKKQIRIKFY